MAYGMNSSMGIGNSSGSSIGQKMAGSNLMNKEVIPKGFKKASVRNFTPEQMQLFQQMFSNVSPESLTGRLAAGDQSQFEQLEAPAMRQFAELQGLNASRFSGLGGQGSLGARKGSGFQNSMNSATSNFAQDLQSKRLAYQQQAIQDLMGMSSSLLGQEPYQNYLVEKPQKQQQSSGWGGAIGAGLGGLGGFFAGGPAGALSGARLGYGLGSGF